MTKESKSAVSPRDPTNANVDGDDGDDNARPDTPTDFAVGGAGDDGEHVGDSPAVGRKLDLSGGGGSGSASANGDVDDDGGGGMLVGEDG